MSYKDEKQSCLNKNIFIVKVMTMYIEDFELLYDCIGFDDRNVVFDIENLIVDLIDIQGDNIHYCPLTIA